MRHVMCRCPVVVGARVALGVKLGFNFPSDITHVLLCSAPLVQAKGVESLLGVVFNSAVWGERKFASSLSSPLAQEAAISRLVRITLQRLPVDQEGEGRPSEIAVVRVATNPPPDAIVGFADGSAIPNPGPCGAGYTLAIPGRATLERSEALGLGDNNIGEMQALNGLFGLLLSERDKGHTPAPQWARPLAGAYRLPRALFFSDSALCCGFLTAGWKCPQGIAKPMARETRRRFHRLRDFFRVTLYWVRGHTGITGNERADILAKRGAQLSRDRRNSG